MTSTKLISNICYELRVPFIFKAFQLWLISDHPIIKNLMKQRSVRTDFRTEKIKSVAFFVCNRFSIHYNQKTPNTKNNLFPKPKNNIGHRNYFSLTLQLKATDFVSFFRLPKNHFRPKALNRFWNQFWRFVEMKATKN